MELQSDCSSSAPINFGAVLPQDASMDASKWNLQLLNAFVGPGESAAH